jgi:uncharacterized protein involved in type VI secretion and phage assembly
MMDDSASKSFYGKYRGSVFNNVDPDQRGRLQLYVPDVLGDLPSTWAEACVPLAGPTGTPMGMYLVPPIGTAVWVEFEAGDPDHPVWVGCIWGGEDSSSLPSQAKQGLPGAPSIVMQTLGQNSLVISDVPGPSGGITLKAASGAMIAINELGITISNAQGATVELSGLKVSINGDGLEVI